MPTTWRENSDKTWTPVIDKTTPLALLPPGSSGTAAAGVSPFAAREDHDHDLAETAHTHTDVDEVVFSQEDAVTVAASGRYYPTRTTTLKKVACSLSTAGSSSTVVDVKKNGSSLGTITLASSDNYEPGTFNTSFTADTDYLTIEVTTAGTGAAKLVATARFET